jgi:nicotinate phosphoribosyltransferase
MMNYVTEHHPGVDARSELINRHAAAFPLQNYIDRGEFNEQVDHARSIVHTDSEIAYLADSQHFPAGTLGMKYLDSLRTFRLPELDIDIGSDRFSVGCENLWRNESPWEIPLMNIVVQLYVRRRMRDAGLTYEQVWCEAERRLREKIAFLKKHPRIKFASFGLRRGWDNAFTAWADDVLANELPDQLVGISCVRGAMRNGKRPSGTIAHEMFMILAALLGIDDETLRKVAFEFLRKWLKMYGPGRSCFIPDTWGSETFLDILFADYRDLADQILTYKIDSGEPVERGELHIRKFREAGYDPTSRKLLFCDGLHIPDSMCSLQERFDGNVGIAPFGPGTHLSFDIGFGIKPISVVVKAVSVLRGNERVPCVKLSDTINKAMGTITEIERYIRIFKYRGNYQAACEV